MADRQTDRPGGGSALGTARSLFLYGSKVPPSLARREFSKSHKLLILSIIAFGAFLVPLGTGIYLPMLDDVQKDLKTSATAINGTLTIYLLVLAIGPLGWSTLADNWGRRPVYLMSIVVFIGGCVGCGLSPNVGVLMACRFLQAAGGSSVMSVGAGTISDVFKVEERARAMSMYYLGPLLGPAVAPPIGGILATYASWRWTFVLLGSAGVAVLFSIFFFLPETLDLSPEAKKKRLRPNPFRSIGYLKYPMVAICFTCAVIMMMAIFTYISNFGRELNDYYHMNSAQVGLMYLPHTIANIPGNVLAGIMADWAIRRSRAQHGRSIPEYRLLVTASGFIGFPLGIMLMAWGIRNVLPVWVLCIAGALIGFNQFTVYTPLQTYLVDIFPTQSASIISLVNLGRYTIAAVAPMVVLAATEAMGAWYLTMWAILVILCGVPVLAVGKFGTKWRESYPPWQPKMEAVEGKGTADEEAVTIGSRGEMDEKAGGKSGEAVGDETVSERTNSSTEAAPSEEVAK